MALQALADVSNLNIIPKSVVNWFVQTLTGIKAGATVKGGLMGNVGYLVIMMGGSMLALGAIVGLAVIAKRNQK
jgi:hypothetical protein